MSWSVFPCKQQGLGLGLHGVGYLQGKTELKTHLANKDLSSNWHGYCSSYARLLLKSFINTSEMDEEMKK